MVRVRRVIWIVGVAAAVLFLSLVPLVGSLQPASVYCFGLVAVPLEIVVMWMAAQYILWANGSRCNGESLGDPPSDAAEDGRLVVKRLLWLCFGAFGYTVWSIAWMTRFH